MKKEGLLKKLKSLPVIDSHEHLPHEKDMLRQKTDVIDLMTPYVCDQLMSCGMGEQDWRTVNDKSLPFEERYALLEPYLQKIRFTTYFQSMMRGIEACCGIEGLTLVDLERANSVLAAGVNTEALFKEHHIQKALTFVGYGGMDYFKDSRCLIPVPTVSYLTPKSPEELALLEQTAGLAIDSLETLEKAIERIFESYRENNIRNIKIGAAYNRPLDYTAPDMGKAAEQLQAVKSNAFIPEKLYGQINLNLPLEGLKDLDNFVIWKCAALAGQYGMTTIFHTGIHAWNRNDPEACHPKHLTAFIQAHEQQRIVLLHLGYPHIEEALLLARYYPNVYLDFAWLHTLDRAAAVATVKRVLELLPLHKLVGFGGDVCTPVNTVGNLSFALENLAEAFAEEITEGKMTVPEAVEICRRWLYENPKEIYEVRL